MGFLTRLRAKVLSAGKIVPATGPRMLPTGTEDFAAHLANEGAGGAHGYDTLEDLAQANPVFLFPPMLALVAAHDRGGTQYPETLLSLQAPLAIRISEMPGELLTNINNYWKPYITAGKATDPSSIEVIQTDTLPAGQLATVENRGTLYSVKLFFGIPAGAKGADGLFRPQDFWAGPTVRFVSTGGDSAYDIRLRKAQTGQVYYQMRTAKASGGNQTWLDFVLPDALVPAGFGWGHAGAHIGGIDMSDRIVILPGYSHHYPGNQEWNESPPANIRRNASGSYSLQVPIRDNWIFCANGSYASESAFPV